MSSVSRPSRDHLRCRISLDDDTIDHFGIHIYIPRYRGRYPKLLFLRLNISVANVAVGADLGMQNEFAHGSSSA